MTDAEINLALARTIARPWAWLECPACKGKGRFCGSADVELGRAGVACGRCDGQGKTPAPLHEPAYLGQLLTCCRLTPFGSNAATTMIETVTQLVFGSIDADVAARTVRDVLYQGAVQ